MIYDFDDPEEDTDTRMRLFRAVTFISAQEAGEFPACTGAPNPLVIDLSCVEGFTHTWKSGVADYETGERVCYCIHCGREGP